MGAAIKESGVPREEIWVTSKLWPTEYGEGKTLEAIDAMLEHLGLEYIDLLNYILKRYAELLHLDSNEVQLQGCFYLLAYEVKRYVKRKLKHCLLSF